MKEAYPDVLTFNKKEATKMHIICVTFCDLITGQLSLEVFSMQCTIRGLLIVTQYRFDVSPETSVNNYHTTLRNIPEERRSHQYRFDLSAIVTWRLFEFGTGKTLAPFKVDSRSFVLLFILKTYRTYQFQYTEW
jgi:hypothetical protein